MANTLDRRDLDLILEVNKKSIEIETEVAEQNEKIIELLDSSGDSIDEIQKKILDLESKANILDNKISGIETTTSNIENSINNLESEIHKNADLMKTQSDNLSRDIFQIRVLLSSGIISLIAQIIQMFIKK